MKIVSLVDNAKQRGAVSLRTEPKITSEFISVVKQNWGSHPLDGTTTLGLGPDGVLQFLSPPPDDASFIQHLERRLTDFEQLIESIARKKEEAFDQGTVKARDNLRNLAARWKLPLA